MILYQDQETGELYNAEQIRNLKRLDDHVLEPSWGVYVLKDGFAVLADCDVRHAEGDEQ